MAYADTESRLSLTSTCTTITTDRQIGRKEGPLLDGRTNGRGPVANGQRATANLTAAVTTKRPPRIEGGTPKEAGQQF